MTGRVSYSEALGAYLKFCVTSEMSECTIDVAQRTLKNLGSFLQSKSVVYLDEISTSILLDWREKEQARVSATSLRTYLSHISSFFSFCTDDVVGLLEKSPYSTKIFRASKSAIKKKESEHYEHLLTEQQMVKIINATKPKRSLRKAENARNKAILIVLLTSGIRNSSLRAISEPDLDWENGRIWISVAKGGKSDYVPFPEVAQSVVKEYLTSGYRPSNLPLESPLFGRIDKDGCWVGYTRENLSGRVLWAIKDICGVDGYRTHAMRHSMATILKRNGMDTSEVSELLMHSDGDAPAVTRRYIEDDHKTVFDRAAKVFSQICVG